MDIEQIKSLVALMVESDLSRLEIREGDMHVLLKKGQPVIMSPGASFAPPAYQAAPANPAAPAYHAAPAAAAPTGASAAAAPPGNELFIRSPMVGTYYSSPDPESPPFVKIGDHVEPDTVVCLVEAMKVFNEIKAEQRGAITRVLVSNGQAIEYDQPLFAISG